MHASRAVHRLVPALLLFAACAAPAADDASDETPDDKGDRGTATGGRFIEVDPTHSSKAFRTYIGKALDVLAADDSELAQLTLKSISAGYVKIDELADLTCPDFERVRADLPDAGLTPADRGTLAAKRTIEAELDGYMWSNRIYVARGQTAKRLAATLIHEVNHVLNRSEVGYYDDLPTSAFVHEYRSFYLEAQFDPAEYAGVDLVDYVITNYELDRSKIRASVLAHPLTPQLLPTTAAWRTRNVTADRETVPAVCR